MGFDGVGSAEKLLARQDWGTVIDANFQKSVFPSKRGADGSRCNVFWAKYHVKSTIYDRNGGAMSRARDAIKNEWSPHQVDGFSADGVIVDSKLQCIISGGKWLTGGIIQAPLVIDVFRLRGQRENKCTSHYQQ